ncbi:protein kinase, ATP binding site-containing protein [Tanacetum coccineum]
MSITDANLEKFQIPLEEIKSATEDFHKKNKIVGGEYSKLYRGQLSESLGNRTAAFKRFIDDRCDGKKEFLNELKVISILNHENIIPFLGYCDEGEEMIMVYEYPVNGSLANYFKDTDKWSCLTWQHRLEICMDAARGLNYLHSGLGQHETVIHGSFMHNNILLDDNLKAKICGFEISELIPGNQPCQQVYKPHTNGMISHKDPIYLETGFLKAESDIYSFGVQLFRILTWPEGFARVSNGGDDFMRNRLTMTVQHYYHNRLDSFIDPAIRDQIDGPSFRMIEEIICKCLSFNLKDRPTMDTLVKTIKDALDIHLIMERGILSSGGRSVKQKEGGINNVDFGNVIESGDMANSGTGFDATHVDHERSRNPVNFHTLVAPAGDGADVGVSMEPVRLVHERVCNTAYGFFLGKRVAYPVDSKVYNPIKDLKAKDCRVLQESWGLSRLVLQMFEFDKVQASKGDREAEVFQVSNDDTAVTQRRLEDKQPEEKTNTDCLVKEREKVHLGIKVGAKITVTGVTLDQEGKGGLRFEVPALDEDAEYRLCLSVSPKVEIVVY